MNLFQKMLYEFETTVQTGSVIGKPWHLSFIKPYNWTMPDQMPFHHETVPVRVDGTEYCVSIEYAVLTIERPWLYDSLFTLPFSHADFGKGQISDGAGSGFLPAINTGIIVTRKIEIKDYYENNNYQVVGWVVKKLPLCPAKGGTT